MRTSARLAIEAHDLDNANLAVRGRRRSNRLTANQSGLGHGLLKRDVMRADLESLANHIVHIRFQSFERRIVSLRQVEVMAGAAGRPDLCPLEQTPI